MSLLKLREQARWYALSAGMMFIIVNLYVRMKFVFEPGPTPGTLLIFSIFLAILTLAFGLLSIPRWQSWIALAIFCYALYWVFFTRLFAFGHSD